MNANLSTAAALGADGGRPAGPAHIAIIMDGNGRWAAQRGLPRVEGHRRGVDALRRTMRAAVEQGVKYLTIYSFSSENWRRPKSEVLDLFGLLRIFIRSDLADMKRRGVRIRIIGLREGVPDDICSLLDEAEGTTAQNDVLTLVVAFNYGARREIVEAARALAAAAARGEIDPAAIDEDMLAARLHTFDIPDPDLIIRTSGEERLSNFLLWQAAYAEFLFMPIFWPDFDGKALAEAIDAFRQRDRRFGAVASGG